MLKLGNLAGRRPPGNRGAVLVTMELTATDRTTLFPQALRYASRAERDADLVGVATSTREVHGQLARYLKRLAG